MEILLSDEMRLAYALLPLAAAVAGAWRFVARRQATDWADRAADVGLVVFLVQYAAVGVPGLVGVLGPWSIAVTTVVLSAALWFAPVRSRAGGVTGIPTPSAAGRASQAKRLKEDQRAAAPVVAPLRNDPKPFNAADDRVTFAIAFFLIAFVVAMAVHQLGLPVLSNDALTYHFPAAVRWLQTGRLGLHETWFFNPANTYSPLAGSAFIAWWIAPVGGTILAKAVQVPPLLLVFFGTLRLVRGLGMRAGVGAVVALAVVLTQPMARQSVMSPKDDIYLAAFFAALFGALSPERMGDRLAGWRVGVALGMALATKYTALLMLPVLLLAVDAPFRAGWRQRKYFAALGGVLLLAGPWYLRNALLTGNPLFPTDVKLFGKTVFAGLFTPGRATELGAADGFRRILTVGDQGIPPALGVTLLVGLVASFVAACLWRAAVLRAPRIRICMVGPVVAVALFYATSPYPEVRFLYPALVLLAGAWAVAMLAFVPLLVAQYAVAATFLIVCVTTAGMPLEGLAVFVTAGVALAGVAYAVRAALARWPERRDPILLYGGAATVMIAVVAVYLFWHAQIVQANTVRGPIYVSVYGPDAAIWDFVADELPKAQTIAYTDTPFVLPLMGPDLSRPVVYVPTRRDVGRLADLPHLSDAPVPGERLPTLASEAATADTDADQWLARLKASGATHLAVFRNVVKAPPEDALARARPGTFVVVFENAAGRVYRIQW